MSLRNVYSTNDARTPLNDRANDLGCAVMIGAGSDGVYVINVFQKHERSLGGFALVDRAELQLIWEALGRELVQ